MRKIALTLTLVALTAGTATAQPAAEPLYRDPTGAVLTMAQLQAKYPGQRIIVAGAASTVPATGTGFYGAPSFGSPCPGGVCPAPVTYRRR
jgi:hypothetical protein